MARNDIALARQELVKAIEADDGTAVHWSRMVGGHLYEATYFLHDSQGVEEVKAFMAGMPSETRNQYGKLHRSGFVREDIRLDRNVLFHYPRVGIGQQGRATLIGALHSAKHLRPNVASNLAATSAMRSRTRSS